MVCQRETLTYSSTPTVRTIIIIITRDAGRLDTRVQPPWSSVSSLLNIQAVVHSFHSLFSLIYVTLFIIVLDLNSTVWSYYCLRNRGIDSVSGPNGGGTLEEDDINPHSHLESWTYTNDDYTDNFGHF